jgi:hypothetical protein
MQALHIVSKNPIENIEKMNSFQTAYEKLNQYLKDVKSNKSEASYEEHEQVITRFVYQIGQEALSEALSHYDVKASSINVGEQTYRFSHSSHKVYQSGLGPVRVECHMYSNRKSDGDGHCISPLELQAGVMEGYWTPTGAKNAMWALSHLTPQETEGLLLQFGGMNPSRSSLDRLPKRLNQVWETQTVDYHNALIKDEKIPDNAVSMSVSLDGVMVGMKPEQQDNETKISMKTEWREASCGTISFFDAKGERLSTIQYGRMPEYKKATLKKLLCLNTDFILQQRPTLNLIHLADGALDNWTFFDEVMPHGFQLVDFYHACDYLKEAFDAAYPKDAAKTKEKFESYKAILRDEEDGVKKVLRALRYLRDQNRTNERISTSLTYFTNNQHRMRYAEAKKKGYPIGSGVVEAACKTLVGQRLKRSGMSWQNNGGQGVLTFRSLIKSHRFDEAWKFVTNKYKKCVTAHRNVLTLVGEKTN